MSYLPSNWLALCIVACITVTATFVFLLYLDIRKNARAKLPLKYRPNNTKKKIRKIPDRSAKDIVKDRYFASKTVLPKNIDFIVIGSGIGSLSCAALLSRVGRRVLVLEQHDVIGGCMHQFDSKFDFDTGIHYIGNSARFLTPTMLAPITSNKVDLVALGTKENGYIFDEYIIGKNSFKARPFSRKKDLMKQFNSAQEHDAINRFYALINDSKLFLMFVFLSKLFEGFLSKLFYKIAEWKYPNLWNKSIADIYNNIFAEARLCGLTMMANYGDIGSKMSDGCMMMMCGLYTHYENGGYFIKGGPQEVTRSIMPIIEANGGRCLANMTVKDIIFDKNKNACGVIVECKNGKTIQIKSKYGVISGAGFRTTYSKIINMEKLCKNGILSNENKLQIENLLNTVKPSSQHFHIFIGFNKPSSELQLCSHNRWYIFFENENEKKDNKILYDYDEFVTNFHAEPLTAPIMGLVSFPSAKDPTYDSKHNGKSSAIILTEIPHCYFKQWEHLNMNLRGDEYNALKKKIADRLIEKLLFEYFPKITKSTIEMVEIGTALSASYYLGTQFGESYGLSPSCERYFNRNFHQLLKPKQPIKQFYLTGQDLISAGFVSALRSGIWTAEHILGYHKFCVVFSGRTLIRDLNILDQYKGKKELNESDIQDYDFNKYKI